MKNINEENTFDEGEVDNQEGMGDVNLEEDVVCVDIYSDQEENRKGNG